MIKVLIVEDDKKSYEFLTDCITTAVPDAKFLYAEDGEKALKVLGVENVDIMFIDRALPGELDGVELLHKVRANILYVALPIIFVTGTDADQDVLMAKYKYFEYITKPYSKGDFIRRVKNFMLSISERKKQNIIQNFHEESRNIFIDGTRVVFYLKDILFAEVSLRHVTLHTLDKVYKNIVMPIGKFINMVDDPLFVQCHKSFAVNIRKIDEVYLTRSDIYEISFKETDATCGLGLTYKDYIDELLDENNISVK